MYTLDSAIWSTSPAQWPIIVFGGCGGLLGSIIDSVIGATLQYSGECSFAIFIIVKTYFFFSIECVLGQDEKGRIVEQPGPGVRHISGHRILDNHSVNLISCILTGIIMPFVAVKCWP